MLYYENNAEIYSKLQNAKIVKTPYGFNRDSNFPQNTGHRNLKEEIGKSAAPINQLNNVPLYIVVCMV